MPRHARILIPVLAAMTLLSTAMPAVAAGRDADTALHVLDTLTVEPQSDTYDADRDRPKDWAEIDDGPGPEYDTRDLILARDLTDVTWNDKGHVSTGTLLDPYTGKTIDFKRTGYDGPGTGNSNAIQIDHVVAFGEAWESGLDKAGEDTVEEYYNDPYVLLAVDGPTNASKNDSDAAEWLPSTRTGDTSYDCRYVARQIGIKARYGLSVDEAEKQAMEDTLAACPTMTVPTDGGAWWEYDDTDTPAYSVDDLGNLSFTVDGEPYAAFDVNTTDYELPDGAHSVGLGDDPPEGWTWTGLCEGSVIPDNGFRSNTFTFVSPDGAFRVTYMFHWHEFRTQPDEGTPSDTPPAVEDDSDTGAPDADEDMGTTPDGENASENQTDQLASTGMDTAGIGAFTLTMLCCGAALGMLRRRARR